MSTYYTESFSAINGQTASAADIEAMDDAIDAAFDLVETAISAASTSQSSVNAQQYAVGTGDIWDQVTPNDTSPTYSAKTHREAADTAQTAAEAAQTAAETAQTAAELAETNAETAETAAELAETNAAASAAAASVSADEAAASAGGLPGASPSREGALIVQNATDDGYDLMASNGTSGQILISAGANVKPAFGELTATGVAAGQGILNSETVGVIPAATPIAMYVASAPSGWAEVTTQGDSGLRIVTVASATGGSVGGTTAYSAWDNHYHGNGSLAGPAHSHAVGTIAAGSHTHEYTEIVNHTHSVTGTAASNGDHSHTYNVGTSPDGANQPSGLRSQTTADTSTNGAHTHTVSGTAANPAGGVASGTTEGTAPSMSGSTATDGSTAISGSTAQATNFTPKYVDMIVCQLS